MLGLALCAAPASAGPRTSGPAKGDAKGDTGATSKGGHTYTTAQQQIFYGLANSITLFQARQGKQKFGKGKDNYLIQINPGDGEEGSGTVMYLCRQKGKKPAKECVDPGPMPELPDVLPGCVACDPSDKDAKYEDWLTKQLAADALHKMLEVMKEGQFWGLFGSMISDMYDAVSMLTGPGSVAFKALKWGAGEIAGAVGDAAKEAAFNSMVQGILDALGLNIDPDMLSTEGGLNAAIALADAIAGDARADYLAAKADWAKCRNDAVAAGKKPVDSSGEAAECNENATDANDAAMQATMAAYGQWLLAGDAYADCLEYNRNLDFETASWQDSPC